MKHVLKSLKHNGIYVPQYELKGFKVKIQGQTIPLTVKSEQMAVAWIRKRQSALSPPDKVFMKNFMREFLEQLKAGKSVAWDSWQSFASEYVKKIENLEANDVCDPKAPIHSEIDFSEIVDYLETGQTEQSSTCCRPRRNAKLKNAKSNVKNSKQKLGCR